MKPTDVNKAWCFFEQSGTFKNVLIKEFRIPSCDVDIQNEYGQTDMQLDLFLEIEKAWRVETTLCDGRHFSINPDVIGDFRKMDFEDESFDMIVFDPPHLLRNVGKSKFADIYGSLNPKSKPAGWQHLKYGALGNTDWRDTLRLGFSESFMVLRNGGFLIFKWNDTDIPISEILILTDKKPVLGHKSGKRSNTHWILFQK